MKAIPERLKEALAREFTQEQIKEGFKRFEWIIRVWQEAANRRYAQGYT